MCFCEVFGDWQKTRTAKQEPGTAKQEPGTAKQEPGTAKQEPVIWGKTEYRNLCMAVKSGPNFIKLL